MIFILPLGIIFVLILVSSTKINLFHLLLLFLAVITFANIFVSFNTMMINFIDIYFWGLVFAYLLFSTLNNRNKFVRTELDAYIFVFLIINCVIIMYSVKTGNNVINACREFLSYFRIFIGFFLFLNIISKKEELTTILLVTFVLCFIACLYGIYQFFSLRGAFIDSQYTNVRIFSFFGNPNTYGGYLEMMFFIILSTIYHYKLKNNLHKTLLCILLFLISMNILFTYSRGSFITTLLLSGIFLAIYDRKRFPLILSLACMVIIPFFDSMSEKLARQISFFQNFNEVVKEYTILHRIAQYLHYIQIIISQPFTGLGWGVNEIPTFAIDFTPTKKIIPGFGGLNSLYFDIAVKSGLPSLIAFLLVFFKIMKYSIIKATAPQSEPLTKAVSIGFIFAMAAIFIHQSNDNLLKWQQIGFYSALLMAFIIKSSNITEQKERIYRIK